MSNGFGGLSISLFVAAVVFSVDLRCLKELKPHEEPQTLETPQPLPPVPWFPVGRCGGEKPLAVLWPSRQGADEDA